MAERHRDALAAAGADGTATFILGGQVAGEPADILLLYDIGLCRHDALDVEPFRVEADSRCSRGWRRSGSGTS
ncbi:MAG TPA: hypothetical protein VK904_05680 [Miltoncostaeaceae bacterium]|nr:hypothetical protein [Miltoncostaeaceae bacterium]